MLYFLCVQTIVTDSEVFFRQKYDENSQEIGLLSEQMKMQSKGKFALFSKMEINLTLLSIMQHSTNHKVIGNGCNIILLVL